MAELTRRGFLKGVAFAGIACAIPISVIRQRSYESILVEMRTTFNHVTAMGRRPPHELRLGVGAFDDFVIAMQSSYLGMSPPGLYTCRGVDVEHFAFKGKPAILDTSMPTWDIRAVAHG